MPEAIVPSVLDAIVGAARRITEVRRERLAEAELEQLASGRPVRPGRFRAALEQAPPPRIIAECKPRSPSRGVLRAEYDPAAVAASYERHGAAAISVLTEPTFFDGDPEHLRAVRAAVSLPVLRKDFIVERYQLLEARAWGADAVLLIVAALTDSDLAALLAESRRLTLDALVEVHDPFELRRAIDAGATIVGVNNRNLKTLGVSLESAESLAASIPAGVVAVAESGLQTAADVSRLAAAGYHAFLVGERLMTATHPGEALRELRS